MLAPRDRTREHRDTAGTVYSLATGRLSSYCTRTRHTRWSYTAVSPVPVINPSAYRLPFFPPFVVAVPVAPSSQCGKWLSKLVRMVGECGTTVMSNNERTTRHTSEGQCGTHGCVPRFEYYLPITINLKTLIVRSSTVYKVRHRRSSSHESPT